MRMFGNSLSPIARPVPALALSVVVALLLSGCSGGSGYRDIDAYMESVRAKPKGRIKPLPEFKSYEAFAYSAGGMRSPFEPPVQVKPRRPGESEVPPPDQNRVKQYLEQFPIGSLRMRGVLGDDEALFALVEDGEGTVTRVREGDYLGQDHGQISLITETQIELTEIVSDGVGGWTERPRTIQIVAMDQ